MNDAQSALNEVILACQAAAGRYRDADDIIEHPELAAWFDRIAKRRDAMADRLQNTLRQQGGLPHGREQEVETFRSLATHLRTAIAEDRRGKLLEICRQSENTIAEAIATAREYSLQESIEKSLARLADDVRDTLVGLQSG